MFQCEVIGNIGNDAEIKDFSGKKYVSFNVAHSSMCHSMSPIPKGKRMPKGS